MKRLLLLSVFSLSCINIYAQNDKAEDGMAMLQEFMEGMANAETRSVYQFPMSMNMHIVSYKNSSKKDEMDIKYYANTSDEILAFESKDKGGKGEATIVYDPQKSTMVIVNDKEKSYMAMSIKSFEKMDMQKMMQQHGAGNEKHDIKCSKSGKTKTIQGYDCEQTVCVDKEDGSKAEVWVTDKLPINITKSAKNTPWGMYFNGLEGMNGMMMQGDFYKNDKLEASMNVTEINTKANHSVQLSKYKKMDMFGGAR